jgi:hypothetical protein
MRISVIVRMLNKMNDLNVNLIYVIKMMYKERHFILNQCVPTSGCVCCVSMHLTLHPAYIALLMLLDWSP